MAHARAHAQVDGLGLVVDAGLARRPDPGDLKHDRHDPQDDEEPDLRVVHAEAAVCAAGACQVDGESMGMAAESKSWPVAVASVSRG